MVLGIDAGKLSFELPKKSYSQGDTINGKLILELAGPIFARGLRIDFVGERAYRQKDTKKKVTIYELKKELSGPKDYKKGKSEFSFKIPLPELKQFEKKVSGGPAGISSDAVAGATPESPKWYLKATLDIPNGLDLNAETQIILI